MLLTNRQKCQLPPPTCGGGATLSNKIKAVTAALRSSQHIQTMKYTLPTVYTATQMTSGITYCQQGADEAPHYRLQCAEQ